MTDRLCRVLLATLFTLALTAVSVADELLFFDDFKDGTSDNWMSDEFGEFDIVDEAFCFLTVCEP